MKLTKKRDIISAIADYATSRDVYREMTEPILFDDGDIWFVETYGFVAVNKSKLKYLYVNSDERGKKYGRYLLSLGEKEIFLNSTEAIAVCPTSALEFYKSCGWLVSKSFVNYHKIIKHGGTIF